MSNTALITGATSGIGQALAEEFARNGHDVIVVSRDENHVDEVASTLARKHGVTALGLAYDLTEAGAAEALQQELEKRNIEIEILVNNAGRGQRGDFQDIPWEDHLEVIRLNIEALTKLTHLYLAIFLERGHGRVLNLGSIAGFQPGPLLSVYHATKAYVVSLSEGIAEEIKDSEVTITCLCPGPTDTEFFDRADASESRVSQNASMQQSAAEVAKNGYHAMMKGETVHISGGMNKALTFLRRILPESTQAKFNEMLYETKDTKNE
ncbi:SDR family oxidoreductase [Pelagicoccus sp. SDUM812002]|uniref:SDR family NAD(P)-dependent oxidoreductase n=1 Tax=Pelagicoccus sp. SDUM812002 TaxID=3041266 RepID=UPI00280C8206|nr:SDR family oxidoreductase [Pelagicoccus sp. SDUM812002]MDQ8184122.1 SDR family oxidoreductase [Pelagicoccus sp. SDUM812002]